MSVVRRYPLIIFFVLAYAFSWWPWPLYILGLAPSPIIGFGPFLAAILVLALTGGKAGVVTLLRRMVRWRVRPVWYAAALLLPVAIPLGATVLNVLLGAAPPSSAELGAWPNLVPTFFLLLLVPGIGGAWEEPGWRGYALPYVQAGRSALVASLIVGVVWAFWHLPLMVDGAIPWSDLAYVVVQTVVYTWLFNNTGGSVLLVMLFHTMNNVISGERHSHGSRPGGYQARGGAFGCESMTSSHALPIRTPEANTSAPPRTTCTADITKLMLKYR